jgi:hypothetical protein
MMRRFGLFSFFWVWIPAFSFAGDTTSAPLTPQQMARLDSVIASFRIASCDSMSIAEGLKKRPPCLMAVHLSEFAQWLITKDKSDDDLKKDLTTRQDCMASSQKFPIDLRGLQVAGDPQSPVLIVAYISASCPMCKFVCSELYGEVTTGTLKGKARIAAKPFTEGVGDRALVAAALYSKFWDYIIALNRLKERPDKPILLRLADSLRIPLPAFKVLLSDADLLKTLSRYHEEGVRNDVSVTPTFFINGKRYRSYKDSRWVVDAALFEAERLARSSQPKPLH